jgi:anti-sigma B factor antagonist
MTEPTAGSGSVRTGQARQNERRPTPGAGDDDEIGTAHLIVGSESVRLVLTGEIDQSMNTDLADAVNEAISLAVPVQIDVRHVRFMDSSGIALIAYLAQRTPSPITMIQPPDVLRFLLEVTHLDEVLNITEDDPGFPSQL